MKKVRIDVGQGIVVDGYLSSIRQKYSAPVIYIKSADFDRIPLDEYDRYLQEVVCKVTTDASSDLYRLDFYASKGSLDAWLQCRLLDYYR